MAIRENVDGCVRLIANTFLEKKSPHLKGYARRTKGSKQKVVAKAISLVKNGGKTRRCVIFFYLSLVLLYPSLQAMGINKS